MEGTTFGYVRVSTKEQCEERQLIALREFPVEKEMIFMDKLSGKDFNRPQYKKLLRRLSPGSLLGGGNPSTGWGATTRKSKTSGGFSPRTRVWTSA